MIPGGAAPRRTRGEGSIAAFNPRRSCRLSRASSSPVCRRWCSSCVPGDAAGLASRGSPQPDEVTEGQAGGEEEEGG